MAVDIFTLDNPSDPIYIKNDESLSAPGSTAPLSVRGMVVVQIAGPATAIDVTVMRSPDGAADNYSPAGANIVGNPSVGLDVRRYTEPGKGFWKIRVNTITGTAKLHMSGQKIS